MSAPYQDPSAGSVPYDKHDPYRQYRPSPRPIIPFSAQDQPRRPPPMRPDNPAASPNQFGGRGQYSHGEPAPEPFPDLPIAAGGYNVHDAQGDHYGQWPVPGHPYAPSMQDNRSPRSVPRRPNRPEESSHPRQPVRDQPRNTPHIQHAHQLYSHPPPNLHHATGQWAVGDGYDQVLSDHPLSYALAPQSPQSWQQVTLPQYQQATYAQPSRRAPLGPPPSARRGPATYYPDVGPVHPIVEETDTSRSGHRDGSSSPPVGQDKKSLKASTPSNRDTPQIYLEDDAGVRLGTVEHASIPEDDAQESDADMAGRWSPDQSAEVTPPSRDQDSPEILVRQASVVMKSTPTLTTVKSARTSSSDEDGIRNVSGQRHVVQSAKDGRPDAPDQEHMQESAVSDHERQAQPDARHNSLEDFRKSSPVNGVAAAAVVAPEAVRVKHAAGTQTPEEELPFRASLLDSSYSSESESEVGRKRPKGSLGASIANELYPRRTQPRSPLAPRDDERVQSLMDSLEKKGAMPVDDVQDVRKPVDGMSARAGKHRPPRLNVPAVHEAEARGSLTSLPDLIRRATKLASNLDRGKTASRMGINWLEGADEEKRSSGSISDILNGFPQPNALTPTASRGDVRRSILSGRARHSTLASVSDAGEADAADQARRRTRRCCGMPLWLFILVLLLFLLLVAAAVVLPVVFVVLPKQNAGNSAGRVSSCETQLTCENGGTSILSSSGFCECLCVNGYTGRTCETYSQQGCTRFSTGAATNATIGKAIPRLLQASQSNFSIPLDGQELLGLFSSSDLSCVAQNALVTFSSPASGKRSLLGSDERQAASSAIQGRDAIPSAAATSNGIIYATGSPTPTSSAASSSAPSSTTSGSAPELDALDFARVAVLYVFEASGELNSAATAQENLQSYFLTGQTSAGNDIDPTDVDLGNNVTCNLTGHTISLGNGTTVGGNGTMGR